MTTSAVLGEHKIDSWRWTATLPLDCNLTTTKAKLDARLLHISLSMKNGLVGDEAKIVGVGKRVFFEI